MCAALTGSLISNAHASSEKKITKDQSAESIHDGSLSVKTLDDALVSMRQALDDVQANLDHTQRRIEKASLNAARKKLQGTIKALEWQRNNLVENRTKLSRIEDSVEEKRANVEVTRQTIHQQVVEQLNAQKEGISGARKQILAELEQTREELADEIEQLQTSIEDQDDIRADRLRALRDAEMTIADMEKHHLSAIESVEQELKRTRQRLEQKIQEQAAINDKFKYYSRRTEN